MRPGQIEIRAFRESDRAETFELADRLTFGMPAWREPDACRAAVRRWVESSVCRAPEEGAFFVAADAAGAVIGFISVERSSHFSGEQEACVGELVVAEAAEGRGIGRRLVAEAEEWARQRGYRTLTLITGAANTPARHFYERLGFLEEEVRLTKVLESRY